MLAKRLLQDISGEYIKTELSSVINKIASVLKKHVDYTEKIDDSFSFKLIEYSPTPDGIFKEVLNACLKGRRLVFTYYSPLADEQTTRTVDPYHMLNYMGTWHLMAYCHKRKSIRDFVLGRIGEIRTTDKTFKIPDGFDANDYLNSAFGIYKGKSVKQVTLRFSPLKTKWVKGQIWHKDQKERVLKDGTLGAVKVVRTSGYSMLDEAALRALRGGQPYWPLPDAWDMESLTIKGHFIYALEGYYIR